MRVCLSVVGSWDGENFLRRALKFLESVVQGVKRVRDGIVHAACTSILQ